MIAPFEGSLAVVGTFIRAGDEYANGVALLSACDESVDLQIAASCPSAGPVSVSWSGAESGGQVGAIASPTIGTYETPIGQCAGVRLGLGRNGIQLIRVEPSDAQGDGTFDLSASAAACSAFVQLLDLERCETSNVQQIE